MSSLINSELSLQDALKICEKINQSKQNKILCTSLVKSINSGESFSNSLKKIGNVFSPLYIALVELGETVGSIKEILEKLAQYLKEKKQTREKLLQALTYPVIVLVTAIFVISVIIFFVFPKLESIFEAFTESSELVNLKVSSLKRTFLFLVIIVGSFFSLICLCLFFHHSNKKIAYYIDKTLFQIPFLGSYMKITCINDFSFAMKILCSSGVPFSNALFQAKNVIDNLYYKDEILNVYKKIISGEEISSAFESAKIFPSYFITWISLAESTGNTENVFLNIHEYYRTENLNIIQALLVSAEPVFILITGVIIFALVVQFVIPVFQLLGGL